MRDAWLRPFLWGAVPLSTLALGLLPILGMRAMVWVIAAWIALLVVRAFVDPVPITRRNRRWCLFLALPFLLMLLDCLRAADLAAGWKATERSASLLLFPVGSLMLGAPASARFRETLMDLFSLSALALAVFANIGVAITDLPAALEAEPGYVYNYRAVFGLVSGLHPPYAAYYFFTAALFQIVRALDGAPFRAARYGSVAALFISGVLLASRMPLFAFAAAACLTMVMRMPQKQAIRAAVGVGVAFVCTIAFSLGMRQRMTEAMHERSAPTSQHEVNSSNIRIPLAQCTRDVIGDHWLMGTGQAQAQASLDTCYRRFNIPLLLDGSYGTHNQPLHWWLCFGITGLLLFVVYFGVLLWSSWRARDVAHLALLVFLLLCMLTENLLARQWGVVLFACFNALFIAGRAEEPARPRG